MHIESNLLTFSATDIANHLACKHLTSLNRAVAEGKLQAPSWKDPALELLQQRGIAHENAYIEDLRSKGLQIIDLRDNTSPNRKEQTVNAMRSGADAIVQAHLEEGRWTGRADVLLRLPEPSELGDWSYEVVDTKLAQETRGGTILQLCLYSDLLEEIQGRLPTFMHVIKPGEGFVQECFRFTDYQAYYRLVKKRLEETIADPSSDATYPNPVPHCDICRWWQHCDAKRREDDHLCLIAGVQSLHIGELRRQDIHTLTHYAEEDEPFRERPKRGNVVTYAKIHGQARIQLKGQMSSKPEYELLAPEPGKGLSRLPEPSQGDIFFDIEADHFFEVGGLEYLFGLSFLDEDGRLQYRAQWALNRTQEKKAFEEFLDFVIERWEKHPDMYIYHFSPYEPAALKRLMGRHGTKENEVDRLLRAERFVDLYAVVRQGLRASVERYSIKDLEPFFGFTRNAGLRDASAARRRIECALEFATASEISTEDKQLVEDYNQDDCLATYGLRNWLEDLRAELVNKGNQVSRPEAKTGEASESVQDRQEEVQIVYEQLLNELPDDRLDWGEGDKAKWLLAHMLDYFRREARCVWWQFFHMHDLDYEDLLDERKAVCGLEFQEQVARTKRDIPIHRYRFPEQEVSASEGAEVHEVGGDMIGHVMSVDHARRMIDIKKKADTANTHAIAVFINERVAPQPLDSSLLALGRSVAEDGIEGSGPLKAAGDLLLKKRPRFNSGENGPLRHQGEDVVDAAKRLAASLDHSVLPIQGPPGTGKTYAGARMILELASRGKRIGVTAVSHKVISKLLEEVLRAAEDAGTSMEVAHKVSHKSKSLPDGYSEVTSNPKALAALDDGKVLGGTAWLWAREDAVESIDYLFVDEAGQMSLAQVLAASRAAHNLVLLGDPQQLEQPQQGAHPEGTEVSALEHILDGQKTIADDKGLFLDATWRLHPNICAFTSEIYYEGRLASRAGLEQQRLDGDTPFSGNGLFYVPVSHEGNQSSSPEEVDAVGRVVELLVKEGVTWTDDGGANHRFSFDDLMVITPYNAQVGWLSERFPELRIGTVDKFQGQEAPVVIYSMVSSSPEDAPRGMSFLYNPNRLNVATSRARCECILIASPRLLEPECRTTEQMRFANGLCRFREMAREVRV